MNRMDKQMTFDDLPSDEIQLTYAQPSSKFHTPSDFARHAGPMLRKAVESGGYVIDSSTLTSALENHPEYGPIYVCRLRVKKWPL